MELEILFRAKCQNGFDYSNGDGWVYGSLLTDGKECGIVKYEDMQFGCFPDDGISQQPDFAFIPCEPETVGQLRHKNSYGSYFDGDVYYHAGHGYEVVSGLCELHEALLHGNDEDICDIKGNIHDNPELLKQ